jgi:hypothetical protein
MSMHLVSYCLCLLNKKLKCIDPHQDPDEKRPEEQSPRPSIETLPAYTERPSVELPVYDNDSSKKGKEMQKRLGRGSVRRGVREHSHRSY